MVRIYFKDQFRADTNATFFVDVDKDATFKDIKKKIIEKKPFGAGDPTEPSKIFLSYQFQSSEHQFISPVNLNDSDKLSKYPGIISNSQQKPIMYVDTSVISFNAGKGGGLRRRRRTKRSRTKRKGSKKRSRRTRRTRRRR